MLAKSYECFSATIEDKVAHIKLNRPDVANAMNQAFWNDLPEIVQAIDQDALARVIVISSTGKHFSAGMDLSVFDRPAVEPETKPDPYVSVEMRRSNIPMIQSSFNALEEARMPVLFACQGGVIGGAVDMVCAGDIRWCTRDAFFTIHETNIAFMADVGTFPRLQRFVAEGWVRQMAYTGERIGANKAKEIGLVNDIYDTQEEMLAAVMATAGEIASKSPLAITGCKKVISYGRDHSTTDTLDFISVWNASMIAPPHTGEAFAAQAEKREANFPDLLPLRKTPL